MSTIVKTAPSFTSQVVNGLLAIKPLANFAKQQARQMIIKRAESIGVAWRKEVQALRSRGGAEDFSPDWEVELASVQNPHLSYPEYYLKPFHAYDNGNLNWQAATEVEVAAYSVHAKIWQDASVKGDARLRQSYHDIIKATIAPAPQDILDIGCSVGLSTFAIQETFSQAKVTGLDLSPYFLAVADYRSGQRDAQINWVHAPAEATGLADASFDLISMFLICHELPQSPTGQIFREARRLLRPGGYLAIMDMNPKSEVYATMPPYILTLLKSTEPYLDEYFALDIEQVLVEAGFKTPTINCNSPRHRTVMAQAHSL